MLRSGSFFLTFDKCTSKYKRTGQLSVGWHPTMPIPFFYYYWHDTYRTNTTDKIGDESNSVLAYSTIRLPVCLRSQQTWLLLSWHITVEGLWKVFHHHSSSFIVTLLWFLHCFFCKWLITEPREKVCVCVGGVDGGSLRAQCPMICTASQCHLNRTFPFERHLSPSLCEKF